MAISTTVQHMGRFWRETGHGGPPTPPRIRLPTKYRHARTPPPPGGGGGAPKARAGWGCPGRSLRVSLQRRGWGGGCRQKRMLNQQEARARDAGVERRDTRRRRRGRGKGCRQGTCGAHLQGRCRPGGELPEKGSREDDRPVSAPARLPAAGAGISSVEEAYRVNNMRRTSRTCDIISCFHNTWASENHSLHLFRLIGRNVCDREVVRTCN